jgi:hypothetical protein
VCSNFKSYAGDPFFSGGSRDGHQICGSGSPSSTGPFFLSYRSTQIFSAYFYKPATGIHRKHHKYRRVISPMSVGVIFHQTIFHHGSDFLSQLNLSRCHPSISHRQLRAPVDLLGPAHTNRGTRAPIEDPPFPKLRSMSRGGAGDRGDDDWERRKFPGNWPVGTPFAGYVGCVGISRTPNNPE